jgi:hypothetical protein
MAATAELVQNGQLDQIYTEPQIMGLVEAVPDMESDRLARMRAAQFIGAVTVGSQTEYIGSERNLEVQPIESLYDAIHKAAEGDPIARKMVETNVRTDVVERTIKAGHIIKVDLHVDEAGKIMQHGQSMESVQANSLRFAADSPQMRERTEAEATNAFRIEQYHREGLLQDYSFVVFSRAADNMTKQQMIDTGFFIDTMSCAIQITTAKDGRLTMESAFVAGVRRPGEKRHDAETVVATVEEFGLHLGDKTAAETIDTPYLIHNSLIPNGAVDVVEVFDRKAGTFFGEAKPRQDYLEYRQKCQAREQMFQPKVDTIVRELINEAPRINSRLEAVKRLHKLSEKHMVEQAAFDHSINPWVFGSVAALHIEQARVQFELGNNSGGLDLVRQAKATAASSSCPTAFNKSLADSSQEDSDKETADDSEDCEFVSKECPVCHAKNVKTRVTKTRITGSCGCSVSK